MPHPANSLSVLIRRTGLAALVRRTVARRRVAILAYHDPTPDVFERHLRYLAPRYSFIGLEELLGAIDGRWSSLPDWPVIVTLDDGWKGNAALAPVLRRYSCTATIYACSGIVGTNRHYWWTQTHRSIELKTLATGDRLAALALEGPGEAFEYPANARQSLNQAEALKMADVVEFGSHSRMHPILTGCDDDDADDEITKSKTEIEEWTGRPCDHFAFPNGDYSDREVDFVVRAGYRSARTIDVGWNTADADPFRLRSFGIPDDASVDRLAADLAGIGFLWQRRQMRRSHRIPGSVPSPV